MSLIIPNISLQDIFTFKKRIRIYTALGVLLPFTSMSNESVRTYKAPSHPVDSNSYVGDTIYREPIQLSLDGYVPQKSWSYFLQLIEGQTNSIQPKTSIGKYGMTVLTNIAGSQATTNYNKSFDVYSVDFLGERYENMALTSIRQEETHEFSTAFPVSLSFTEIIQVQAKNTSMSPNNVKKAQYATLEDKGTTKPEKLRSTLHKIFY